MTGAAFYGFAPGTRNGLLREDRTAGFTSRLFGYDGVALGGARLNLRRNHSTFYGFVTGGRAFINGVSCFSGMWFALPTDLRLQLDPQAAVMVVELEGYTGLPTWGGPIEAKGRLKYIDRCSDTLLVGPLRQGDPCLNHLHFPEGIDQTQHTHPRVRMGMVVRGKGMCHADGNKVPLAPGLLFSITPDGLHKFSTLDGESMDVIAFHPDSDWGPTDEENQSRTV